MAFKPIKQDRPQTGDFEDRNQPVPRSGSRKARISLIVDMGVQDREDFEDEKTGEKKPQKPCQQVAVYADLVADNVDYGGNIGKQQYRLCLNKSFMGKITGVNFVTGPAKDAKGNILKDKPWCLHPQNALTKLAKVTGLEHIIHDTDKPESLDISLLLNQPFMANVEVKETPHKEGKKDKDGNLIVYRNVNYKGPAPVPEDDDGEPMPIADLKQTPRCITFDNATVEDIQFIRAGLLKQIKLANNYVGSQMQKAIEAYEAANGGASGNDDGEEQQEEAPKTAAPKKPAAPKAKPKSAPVEEEDEDTPF
jgi:hypothetical protein